MKPRKVKPPATTATSSRLGRIAGQHLFRLYVAGATEISRQAIQRARQLCQAEPGRPARLEVIDIYQQPGLARDAQIIATPTLVRERPRPTCRFIGNLTKPVGLFLGTAIQI